MHYISCSPCSIENLFHHVHLFFATVSQTVNMIAVLQQWVSTPKAIATAIFLVLCSVLYYWGASRTRAQIPHQASQQQQGLQYSAQQEEELIRRRRLAVEKQQAQLEAAAAAAAEKRAQQEQAERVCMHGVMLGEWVVEC